MNETHYVVISNKDGRQVPSRRFATKKEAVACAKDQSKDWTHIVYKLVTRYDPIQVVEGTR